MLITLWEQSPDERWQTTRLAVEDQITVTTHEDGTSVFVYERKGKKLAVLVDDTCQPFFELEIPAFFSSVDALENSLIRLLEPVGLKVELVEITTYPDVSSVREFEQAVFQVITR